MSSPVTITVDAQAGVRKGDHIRLSDNRHWLLKLWHWCINKKMNFDYRVTSVSFTGHVSITPDPAFFCLAKIYKCDFQCEACKARSQR